MDDLDQGGPQKKWRAEQANNLALLQTDIL